MFVWFQTFKNDFQSMFGYKSDFKIIKLYFIFKNIESINYDKYIFIHLFLHFF